jgi:hypothetical protein
MNVKLKRNLENVKVHIPNQSFKICDFCKFKQDPINDGKQIRGDMAIYQFLFIMVHMVHI